jgi:hypothetical protein
LAEAKTSAASPPSIRSRSRPEAANSVMTFVP